MSMRNKKHDGEDHVGICFSPQNINLMLLWKSPIRLVLLTDKVKDDGTCSVHARTQQFKIRIYMAKLKYFVSSQFLLAAKYFHFDIAVLMIWMLSFTVDRLNTRMLKCLIPASVVPENAVTKAISWMCTRKPSMNIQVSQNDCSTSEGCLI